MTAEAKQESPRLFLSHSSLDKTMLGPLAKDLQANGVRVWYDDWEIAPGDSIVEKINEGLESCDVFVVALSRASVESRWVRAELDAAMVRRIQQVCRLIPIRLEQCDIPPLLAPLKRVNFDELPYGDALAELLKGVFRAAAKAEPEAGKHPAEIAREALGFHAFIVPNHLEGTDIAGIKWRNEYSDVRLAVANRKPFDLENLDLTIRFDTEIVRGGQLGMMPDVTLIPFPVEPPNMLYSSIRHRDDQGRDVEESFSDGALAVPAYRVLCKRLLAGQQPLQLVFATAALKTDVYPNGAIAIAIDQFAHPPKRPTLMEVRGRYEITNVDGTHPRYDIGVGTYRFP